MSFPSLPIPCSFSKGGCLMFKIREWHFVMKGENAPVYFSFMEVCFPHPQSVLETHSWALPSFL